VTGPEPLPLGDSSTVAPLTAADASADAAARCQACGLVGWLIRAPGGVRCQACGALSVGGGLTRPAR
jgi:hypothetical protein